MTRTYYLRDAGTITSTSRGVPIAVLVSEYDAPTKMVKFAVAATATTSFEKQLFRTMAAVRLDKKSLTLTFDIDNPTGHEINRKIMTALSNAAVKKHNRSNNKHHGSAATFANFLKKEVASGKKLNDVLIDVETKSRSDWRNSISTRVADAAKNWLEMSALKDTKNGIKDTFDGFGSNFKDAPAV